MNFSPFNGGSTVWHCLEWEEFGRKRACLLICGWFEEESTEPITVVDVSAWSRLTAIEINTTTFFFLPLIVKCWNAITIFSVKDNIFTGRLNLEI